MVVPFCDSKKKFFFSSVSLYNDSFNYSTTKSGYAIY